MFCLNFVDPPSSLCSIFFFFFSIFQGYCSGIFIIKYLISNKALVLSWFTYTKEVLSWFLQIVREMTLHNVFIQTLGEWMNRILLLKDLFSAWQISVYPLEYLPQTLKQKSNTCIPLCLVCKFVSSVTLLSNSFATFWHVLWVSIFTPTPLCSLYLPNFIFFPLKTHDGLKIFIFFFFFFPFVCMYIYLTSYWISELIS